MSFLRVLLSLLLLLVLADSGAQSQPNVVTQCVTTASAGGTGDAISIPKLPCVPTTTLLTLSITAANTTTTPTLTPVGGLVQPIVNFNGSALAIGQLAAGAKYILSNDGFKWYVLAPGLSSGGGVAIPNAPIVSGDGSVLGTVTPGTGLSLSGTFPSQTLNASGGSTVIPNAPLTSGNGTVLGTVTPGTGLSLSGSFPAQTLNATGGGGAYGIDPRTFGATCGSADSTGGIQSAINSLASTGGVVIIPCPMTVAGQLILAGGGISIVGDGPVFYPGQSNIPGPAVWPPAKGPALNCTSTSVSACILIDGAQGTGISYLNLGNPQVFPPSSGTWVPTVFPPLIATANGSGWQGLTIEHVSCTASYQCIDIEGSPNYVGQFTGTQIIIRDIWCNPCINYGVKIRQIDNPFILDHMETTYSWGLSQPSSGAYMRLNARGIVVDYCAACNFTNLDLTFGLKSAIEFNNDTVANNFGSLTFAASALTIVNSDFNQVCQALTTPGGNGTILDVAIVNANFWGDQSGFACSTGRALISMNTNDVRLTVAHANVYSVDTFIAAGCGEGCNPGGGAWVKIGDIVANNYSTFSANQNFINIPSGTTFWDSDVDKNLIFPQGGGGKYIGPGPDSTQGYEQLSCIGGGQNSLEGAACLSGSGPGSTNSGAIDFYTTDHVQRGFVGYMGGAPAGVTLQANGTGNVYIKQAGTPIASFGITAGKSNVNFSPMPTTPPSGTGSAYLCVDNLGNLYVKGSCP